MPDMGSPPSEGSAAQRYIGALVCAGAALLLRLILRPVLDDAAFHLFPLAAAAAALWGLGPGLLAAAAGAVAGQWLLHPSAPF
ncbi:MAG TPA: hypothetical protein VFO85_13865, partial [Vicinamibacteria bacterium]|nr:hypothetical protein [Vicinamibacteria bacterium]